MELCGIPALFNNAQLLLKISHDNIVVCVEVLLVGV